MSYAQGYALLIGIGNYQDPTLSAPITARDAAALAAAVKDPATAGYPPEQVTLLTGATPAKANG